MRYSLILLLLMAMPAFGQEPPAAGVATPVVITEEAEVDEPVPVITGPSEVRTGTLAIFTASNSIGGGFDWKVIPNNKGAHRFEVFEGGIRMAFASPDPGLYEIVLSASKADKSKMVVWVLNNGGVPDIDPIVDPVDPPVVDPPVVDPPNKKWQIAIIYESDDLDNYSPEQQSVIKSLTFRKRLKEAGHHIIENGIIDKPKPNSSRKLPKNLKLFVDATNGDPLPRIAVCPLAGGVPVRDFDLPADEDAVLTFLEELE